MHGRLHPAVGQLPVKNEKGGEMGADGLQTAGPDQADGGAQGLPRVLRARWIPTIRTWMDMGGDARCLISKSQAASEGAYCGSIPTFLTSAAKRSISERNAF